MKSKLNGKLLIVFLAAMFGATMAFAKPSGQQTGMNASADNTVTSLVGESKTLLPNGAYLILGGQTPDGKVSSAAAIRDSQGHERVMAATLSSARAYHSATVLPNGSVLVLGGIGSDGHVVNQGELFDPQTEAFQSLSGISPSPRAFHTATLLTEGRVLIAGGVGKSGQAIRTIEVWDFRSGTTSVLPVSLEQVRRNHQANLLGDGTVLLSGGKDALSSVVSTGTIIDVRSNSATTVTEPNALLPSQQGPTQARATSPQDGDSDVPVNTLISIRFSRPLLIQMLNSQTVRLSNATESVEAKVVGAEGGMLAFLTPAANLIAGTTYTVSVSATSELDGTSGPATEFSFTTAAQGPADGTWVPTSDWSTHAGHSKWQDLPPLKAPAGVTALAGQVLTIDGNPLKNVTLTFGNAKTTTDGTGRFLLKNLPAGHSSLMVLANTANTQNRQYGIYEIGVTIQSRITNVLTYTIWMTPLDSAHTVTIPSPTTQETVITSPYLPGLELHIAAGTTITGYDGQVVHQVNITPIPLDRPPFPLPKVQVPIYFTIQPGSAYISVKPATAPQGVRLFYPNSYNAPPGTAYSFWNYDPDQKGWYVYGMGKVAADRNEVIPNAGVVVYEFSGAMVSSPGNAPANGPIPGNGSKGADPVDLQTGLFTYTKTDLTVRDVIPLFLTRTYRPNDATSRSFGIGTNDSYDMFLVGANSTDSSGWTWQDLILPDGGRIHFSRTSPCTDPNGFCGYLNAVFTATSTLTDYFGATITWQPCSPGGAWTMKKKDGTVLCFTDPDNSTNARAGAPVGLTDRYGNTLTFTRDANSNLTQITSPNGRYIQFAYDTSNRVTQALDNGGRVVKYGYDIGGRLTQVTDANNGVWNYAYDTSNNMVSIQDPRGNFYLVNQYDGNSRVIQQTLAGNTNFYFSYTIDSSTGNITQADMTDPRGIITRMTFDPASGYKTGQTLALGKTEQESLSYTHDPLTNLTTKVVDSLNRETDYSYDSNGNLLSVTRLAGTSTPITTSLTYTPQFNEIATITDPLNHTTSFGYDNHGSVQTITDPLSNQIAYTSNASGQIVTVTNAVQKTTTFTYSAGNLASITDPLGNTNTQITDSLGRVISRTNALGRRTRYIYNALDQITQVIDPLGKNTVFSYDANGNLVSVTDPKGNATSYIYNNRDLVTSRADPLQRIESYTYDADGNMLTFSDRKGQITTYKYDNLNRPNFVGFGTQGSNYTNTIAYQYDAGNRLLSLTDSLSGTITRGYDGLDRLTSEVTPQGSISYTYDSSGRRATMQVAGQPQIYYTFDNANRLTQLSQGTTTIGLSYDQANRRSSLTLPNGIVASYSYDDDSRLRTIAYNSGITPLGSITYGYDAVGMQTSVSGSLAQVTLPQAVTSASYDVGNELLSWNGGSLSYDQNGNMLSDGTNTFSWDVRNQLVSLNGASPQYDGVGRRVQNPAGTKLVYDLANPVQEQRSSTVTANTLMGGVDEAFWRVDSTGEYAPITDFLGSTLSLTDSQGNVVTKYGYSPFGATTQSGASNSNLLQFSGREDDGGGIYYYRARYYSSQIGRFISQDPIGYRGGLNFYTYAGNNPISRRDPYGADWQHAASDFVAGAGDILSLGLTAYARDQWGDYFYPQTPSAVHKCSVAYHVGQVTGFGLITAISGGAGASADAGIADYDTYVIGNSADTAGWADVPFSKILNVPEVVYEDPVIDAQGTFEADAIAGGQPITLASPLTEETLGVGENLRVFGQEVGRFMGEGYTWPGSGNFLVPPL